MYSTTKPVSNISASNLSTEEACNNITVSSAPRVVHNFNGLFNPNNSIIVSTFSPNTTDHLPQQQPQKIKKKRSLPGNPDPEAEVIALSPKTLMATNRFVCEICKKGFQRDQNLQLHRRGHNLPWKLKQRSGKDQMRKRVYICPELTCVHNQPSRALGDLTGIKKHFCRKHGEKKWKCEKCSKIYAVQSDWKAHTKTCGTREYRCDCGILFSRKDSFVTHRAFCDALAEESARIAAAVAANQQPNPLTNTIIQPLFRSNNFPSHTNNNYFSSPLSQNNSSGHVALLSPWDPPHHFPAPHLSATALLQKAATVGAQPATWQKSSDRLTRDFLGLAGPDHRHVKGVLSYGEVDFAPPQQKVLGFAGLETWADH